MSTHVVMLSDRSATGGVTTESSSRALEVNVENQMFSLSSLGYSHSGVQEIHRVCS